MLTRNEKMLIADTLNGCNILVQCDPSYLRLMVGDSGAIKNAAVIGTDKEGLVVLTGSTVCSGLEHEVYDAIRLNGLDQKWEVNGSDLIHKIREMTPELREKLIRCVAEVWERNDENFERDLEACEV
jgi:hypothetical protein